MCGGQHSVVDSGWRSRCLWTHELSAGTRHVVRQGGRAAEERQAARCLPLCEACQSPMPPALAADSALPSGRGGRRGGRCWPWVRGGVLSKQRRLRTQAWHALGVLPAGRMVHVLAELPEMRPLSSTL
jgi:hypothetical protein